MSKYRAPSAKTKYYIPKEDYLTAIHYSLRYPLWLAEVNDIADTSAAIRYDKDKVQTSGDNDPTFKAALKISKINEKIKLVDDIISLVTSDNGYYLRLGVCYGLTFDQLKSRGMAYERDAYYLMRRKYYYELSLVI